MGSCPIPARFAIPGCYDDPPLPIPAPRLYAYQLPPLPGLERAGAAAPPAGPSEPDIRRLPLVGAAHSPSPIQLASYQQEMAQDVPAEPVGETLSPPGELADSAAASETVLRIVPLPESVWESLPTSCLTRMFEFRSIREEYQRTYQRRQPPDELRDNSPRLSLEGIVQLSLINNRAYQTQKENLYRASLQLSLERYAYALKFTTSGNGTTVDYLHDRTAGVTENRLAIASSVGVDKVLATGGELLARFANDVVLTFNGPDGFAADVGSELLLDISQPIFQRDVVFERLTQSERDVVYAARDLRDSANSCFATWRRRITACC